jgi:hypothetical protein
MEHKRNIALPNFITGSVDIGRLLREIEAIDDSFLQLKLRKSGVNVKMPKTSLLMDRLISYYGLNLIHEKDRQELSKYLESVKTSSPGLHMSFSTDPSPAFLESIVSWLRANIHPEVLLSVGLQPTICVGSIVRTNNKYFDFSLSQNMKNSKKILLDKLAEDLQKKPVEQLSAEVKT